MVFLAPIRVLEELMKPVTLALRLFGNLFVGQHNGRPPPGDTDLLFPSTIPLTVVWKMFDMAIGVIQAFIFALLTILYYQFAVAQKGTKPQSQKIEEEN